MPHSSPQAQQIDYNLHTLGWKAFQDLCSTVIAEVWGQTAQIFSETKDGGRDGAFNGLWHPQKNQLDFENFVVQCKYTCRQDKSLNLSDLADELDKVENLVHAGLCKSYLILTNAKIGGDQEKRIRTEFEKIKGIKNCRVYGKEWITSKINETPRLRMLVPQVYGLGDLSQILDVRAYEQSAEILSSLGDDIRKFVVTEAHQKSAKAILKHGFVLLLGEPASGKSTIAAAIAMAALDEWGCSTLKISHPADFRKHSNPKYENQFFWVDDAFGSTQHEQNLTGAWNQTFPYVNAAIKRGAKVIFTSRNYIYRAAKNHLKESALPVSKQSQVVINVEKISQQEKEQILYNHLKHGNQPTKFKSAIKPFLPSIASNKRFSPEIARRLSDPFFTKKLRLNSSSINRFVEKPVAFLKEVIETLSDHHKAALALIFIRGGLLESPIKITKNEQSSIDLLYSDISKIRAAYRSLEDSLVIKEHSNDQVFWKYKHPTIRDAFALMVSEDQELLDIYLGGVSADELFTEVTCGISNIKGVSLVIPKKRFPIVLKILEIHLSENRFQYSGLNQFLAHRCSDEFLKVFVHKFEKHIESLTSFSTLEYYDPSIRILAILHQASILTDSLRKKSANRIEYLVTRFASPGFPNEYTRSILTDSEHSDILMQIRDDLLPSLDDLVDDTASEYDPDTDPDYHFEDLKKSIESYTDLLDIDECCDIPSDDHDSMCYIENALQKINDYVSNLDDEYQNNSTSTWSDDNSDEIHDDSRSVFDDVDQ